MSDESGRSGNKRNYVVKPKGAPFPHVTEEMKSEALENDPVYRCLLEARGEEYAELYLASDQERMDYIIWWQNNYDTENDKIADLGLASEYFPTLEEAKAYLASFEEKQES